MFSFLKKLFGSKGISDDTAVLSKPDLTIARANNEMQLRTQTAVDMWGLDTASWAVGLDSGTITFINDEKEMVTVTSGSLSSGDDDGRCTKPRRRRPARPAPVMP